MEIRPPCINARAPLAGHLTACCSNDSGALPLVSQTGHALDAPHCWCSRAGAPVTLRFVTRAASGETFLARGLSARRTETLSCPTRVKSCARVCSGAAPKMSKNLRQPDSLRIPAAMCLTPRADPGESSPCGSTSVSNEGGSSLATLRGSPGIVMTSPRGARRNAIWRSLAVKD